MKPVTEEAVSRVFLRVFAERPPSNLRGVSILCSELDCLQGRPDHVGSKSTLVHCGVLASALNSRTRSEILARLHRRAPRTLPYVKRATGYTGKTIVEAMRVLELAALVRETAPGRFLLTERAENLRGDLWSFELKVEQWQRALFQATQYQAFASRSVVVLPEAWVHRAERNLDRFAALGVGLLAVDMESEALRVILPPKRVNTIKAHFLYALGGVLAASSR